MNRKISDIQSRLARLCQDYARQLPDKIAEIEQAWTDIQDTRDSKTREHLLRLSHTLAGSGASYGYRQITEHCRQIEQLLVETSEAPSIPQTAAEQIEHAIIQLRMLAEQEPDNPIGHHKH